MDQIKNTILGIVSPQTAVAMNIITGLAAILVFIGIILLSTGKYTPAIVMTGLGILIFYFKNQIFSMI